MQDIRQIKKKKVMLSLSHAVVKSHVDTKDRWQLAEQMLKRYQRNKKQSQPSEVRKKEKD